MEYEFLHKWHDVLVKGFYTNKTILWPHRFYNVERQESKKAMQKTNPQRDFAAGVYLSEAQNPIPSPPYTLYIICVYSIPIHTRKGGGGGGGRVETERRLEGQQFTELGRKYQHDRLYLLSILIYTCRKVPLHVIFLNDDILFWCLYSLSVHSLQHTVKKKSIKLKLKR